MKTGICTSMGRQPLMGLTPFFFHNSICFCWNFGRSSLYFSLSRAISGASACIFLDDFRLTAVSLKSSKKMQALAPEIALLKEKYKDDLPKFQQKQMELWKKNGVNPMSGCLPMLVQMPVFMGFYTMIRSAIELRGASFLWAADLSKPDTVFLIPRITFIPVLSSPDGLPLNLLPLLMVAVMIWQAHLQPASPGMDPSQQKMMRYIPLMFLLIFYNYSSGMALYM